MLLSLQTVVEVAWLWLFDAAPGNTFQTRPQAPFDAVPVPGYALSFWLGRVPLPARDLRSQRLVATNRSAHGADLLRPNGKGVRTR